MARPIAADREPCRREVQTYGSRTRRAASATARRRPSKGMGGIVLHADALFAVPVPHSAERSRARHHRISSDPDGRLGSKARKSYGHCAGRETSEFERLALEERVVRLLPGNFAGRTMTGHEHRIVR